MTLGKRTSHLMGCVLALGISCSALTTVTARLQAADSSAQVAGTHVHFQLLYCGANQARVLGTSILAQTVYDVVPDATGLVSKALYGNDQITCGLFTGNTRWRVTYYSQNVASPAADFNIIGTNFDLTTATPVTVAPVVVAPTGDSTYWRIDGGNGMPLPLLATPGPIGATTPSTGNFTNVAAGTTNGVINEEMFTGANVAARINAAVASCGTATCIIVIPPNAPIGLGWTIPPANVIVQDQRLFNGLGFASNMAPLLHSSYTHSLTNGANLSYESSFNSGTFVMDLESHATTGGTAYDGARANSGSLLIFADRMGGNRPIWGLDLNFQYSNQNNTAYGLEIDAVNNSGVDDSGNYNGRGLILIAGGANRNGVGITVQGSGQVWQYGSIIQSYAQYGTMYQAAPGRTGADVLFLPPDDLANSLAMQGRNHANTATTWSIDDVGNVIAASVAAQVVNASTSMSAPTITASSSLAAPTVTASVAVNTPAIAGTGTASFAVGAATVAGTGATASCNLGSSCDSISGSVSFATGSGISTNGIILTVTFPVTRTNKPGCTWSSLLGGSGAPLAIYAVPSITGITFTSYAVLASSVSSSAISYICAGK